MADAGGRNTALRFRTELQDFLRFLRRPRFGPRLPDGRSGNGIAADWRLGAGPLRLLQWAALLWLVNVVFLGPLAVMAAEAGGAQHRLDIDRIPWLQALLWAPLVEELLFRYGLRRPGHALLVVPVIAYVLFTGPQAATILLVGIVLLLLWREHASPRRRQLSWHARLQYREWFPHLFYLATLLFAVIHLHNFNLNQTPWWLLPLLVLPQFVTGLVLGWLRVRRGIADAIILHAMFNGGPLLLIWVVLKALD